MTDPYDFDSAIRSDLTELDDELARAQRLSTLGTLAAGVAHEINNLLTPVLSYAYLARSSPDDRALQAKAYGKIITGVETACGVAQAMLSFSAVADQDARAAVQRVLDGAMECLGRHPAKDGIKLVVGIGPNTDVAMQPLALQQVLLNLVLNARDAIKAHGGHRIVVEAAAAGDGTVRITVADDGPGISADVVARLFEPFVSTRSRPDGAPRAGEGGSGLGLMVTRHLVESAGGAIDVITSPGQGAKFVICLPSASEIDAEDD